MEHHLMMNCKGSVQRIIKSKEAEKL
jgi:hypothetical protein